MPAPDLAALLPSWELSLRAERKSPSTIKVYGDDVRRFLVWCEETGRPPELGRRALAEFVADLLEAGAEPATARSRYLSLRRFSAWLVEERELLHDPLEGAKPPKLDAKVVPVLTEDRLRALISACEGPDLRDRRDEAIVRLMTETGVRAGEVIARCEALPQNDERGSPVGLPSCCAPRVCLDVVDLDEDTARERLLAGVGPPPIGPRQLTPAR